MIKLPYLDRRLSTAGGQDTHALFQDTSVLNHALLTFLVALPAMVLLYKWAV